MLDCKKAFLAAIHALPILWGSPGMAVDVNSIPGIKELSAGRLYISTDPLDGLDPSTCERVDGGEGPQSAAILNVLVPALIKSGVGLVKDGLLTASGYNQQKQHITGILNEHFYCKLPTLLADSGAEQMTHYQRLANLHIKSRSAYRDQGKAYPKFDAAIRIDPSADGTAFKLVPTKISYPQSILNSRSYGAVLSVTFTTPTGNYEESTIMPLAWHPCGRSRQVNCIDENGEINTEHPGLEWLQSEWLQLPPAPSGDLFTAGQVRSREDYRSTPVTITAQLWEVSDYNKFLKWLSEFVGANQDELAQAITDSLPPLTQQERIAEFQTEASRATALADYLAAKTLYDSQVATNAECSEITKTWKEMVSAASKAEVIIRLSPPACL